MAAVRDAQNASSISRNRLRSIASCISSHFDNGSLTFELGIILPLPTYYANVRFASKRRHSTKCPLRANSGHTHSVVLTRRSILISAGKLHRGPLCIARKTHAWRFSGIREYCLDPRRRLGNAALHLYHSYAQHCWRVQRILVEVFLGSFAGTRAYCLLALACRHSVFEVLCRNLTQLICLFSLEQHQTGRQKLTLQQLVSAMGQ